MPAPRRLLPAVDALLAAPDVAALARVHPRSLVVRAVRETLEAARANSGATPAEGWGPAVRACLERLAAPSFVPVINATGVVLHTNLGRAPLAASALAAMHRIAAGYASLEYDVGRGRPRSRPRPGRGLAGEPAGAVGAPGVDQAAGALVAA